MPFHRSRIRGLSGQVKGFDGGPSARVSAPVRIRTGLHREAAFDVVGGGTDAAQATLQGAVRAASRRFTARSWSQSAWLSCCHLLVMTVFEDGPT
jgi:hypothetical protein